MRFRLLVETALDQEEGLHDVPKYRAILRAVADGCTGRNEIAQLANDHRLRGKLATLLELGYLDELRNVDARPNEAVRYLPFQGSPGIRAISCEDTTAASDSGSHS